jgi:catechol 2,3-dioxygenase-like lactoylglutathione lyase family enzyme
MIRAIHHAQVTIPPGATTAAKQFYCEFLGLREIARPPGMRPGGFWVAVGDRSLHVGAEEGIDRIATRAHVAYEVDDLPALRKKLTASGFAIEDPTPIPGYQRVHTRDPFGNLLEFIQPIDG